MTQGVRQGGHHSDKCKERGSRSQQRLDPFAAHALSPTTGLASPPSHKMSAESEYVPIVL